jgi:hypothetical protein
MVGGVKRDSKMLKCKTGYHRGLRGPQSKTRRLKTLGSELRKTRLLNGLRRI